jgi:hypothetical protein
MISNDFTSSSLSRQLSAPGWVTTDTGIQLIYQFTDDLGCSMQEDLQSGTVIEEARPQQVVGGEGDVEVRDFEEIADDVVNPVVDAHLAAGGAKAGLAGEGDTVLVLATRADVAGITGIGIAAGHETLDDLSDVRIPMRVGTLVWGDFGFQALVAPAVPMVTEYLTEEIVAGGVIELLPRR